MSEWQKVSAREFPTDESILLYYNGYHYIGTYCHTEDDVSHHFIVETGLIVPTHWMPLPKPPIEGE